jgi:hypothetical protein
MNAYRPTPVPTLGRLVLGVIWISGAIINGLWTLPAASDAWESLGRDATFAAYRWFFSDIVSVAPELMTVLLILGELALGVMILARDPWARSGLLLSVVWSVFLLFLIWPYTLSTLVLLVLAAWLLRFDHERAVVDLVRHRGGWDQPHRFGA